MQEEISGFGILVKDAEKNTGSNTELINQEPAVVGNVRENYAGGKIAHNGKMVKHILQKGIY